MNEEMSGSSSAIRIRATGAPLASHPRDDDGEGGADAERALEVDRPAVRFGDRLDDRQAEPGTAVAATRVAPADEAVEDALRLGRRDPHSRVADPDVHLVAARADADSDRVARGRVLHGVVGEVERR